MLTGWVYPIIAHAVWDANGFLSAYSVDPLWGVGMVDFAGSGVVHLTGGTTALFATLILGPRRGRFHDETGRRLDTPREFQGHSVALQVYRTKRFGLDDEHRTDWFSYTFVYSLLSQMLGTFILWFGWYGFNGGSALLSDSRNAHEVVALAAVNTTLSGGTAGIVALMANLWYLERYTGEPFFDLKYAMNGSLAGLVAITGGCGVMEPWSAVVTGFFAGLLYLVGSRFLVKIRLDDAVDAIPVHMFNGIWGIIAVGLFASPSRLLAAYGRDDHPGLFFSWYNGDSDAVLLGTQLVGLLFMFGWVMFFMLPFFIWLDWKGWFRSDPLEEIVGLDTSYHGGLALLAGTGEGVNPEYISAYKKKKSEENDLRRRNRGLTDTVSGGTGSAREAEDDYDDSVQDEPITM